ncbi:RdgB/HAM1 family non-canonical purine NTP pyrophosphatase [Ruficoccus amylovorans]|uniref:dITP/XTP pyrophosphatase n=1 Tax=Ruficoccus amylovorans TaxID=1804625 RepID=A0A842HEY1_9BACT|nr:RdgB/HAM1 family non-canonical purine NTP pyrophosphatase [Ruficoccus amylovorans]MBC2594598.1 RdgB/HAM1 family non-canonical purine NTP pyrophosphatase [Ruficoccus amylovorans]
MSKKFTVYLATSNAHKVEEIAAMLAEADVPVVLESAAALGGMPDVDESGSTFVANARLKAAALAPKLPGDAWVLADDSGLAVDILGGAPGVRSARYAGTGSTSDENNHRLMDELAMVPRDRRTARFVCCFVLMDHAGKETVFNGTCEGRIVIRPRGHAGFGYDPLFAPEGYDQTLAELGSDVKNHISHRAKAVQALIEWFRANGE